LCLCRRTALPDHPLPAELPAPAAWQLRVDGLVAQPLALSLREVDALAVQAHTADFVCEEGWVVPAQPWDGVAVAALLARAGVQPDARVLKGHAGDSTVLLPLEDALTGGALLRLVALGWAGF
jgi:DMSO/TMAO reductase YedYZ molybdopterin-dependent catalytic subunit